MQVFPRSAIDTHQVGVDWPAFLGMVQIGEPFVIETERFKAVNGPIRIEGLAAGDDVAIHIEEIEMVGPFEALTGEHGEGEQRVKLELGEDDCFYFPRHFRLQARPTIGNIGILPSPNVRAATWAREAQGAGSGLGWRQFMTGARGKHCHQDCPWLAAGSIIHMKSQIDGVGLCVSDAHGYQAAGALAYAGIEVSANVRLRAERSQGWLVDWPLIETEEEIMVLVAHTHPPREGAMQPTYADIAREAYGALRRIVADRTKCSVSEADQIVATAVDLRNCSLMGLGGMDSHSESPWDTSVVAVLPKASLLPRG